MDDFDLLVINTYLNLARGDINSGIKALRYSNQFIEEKVRSTNGRTFPVDVLLFSKHYNHAFLIEIKNTTTSDFNATQAENYDNLDHTSLTQTLPNHREINSIKIDVAYHGNQANESSLVSGLSSCSTDFPLLVFDSDDFTIRRSTEAGDFKYAKLKSVFSSPVSLNIDDIDKVIPYIKYSTETDNYKIAKTIMPALVEKIEPTGQDGESSEVLIEELTKDTYSLIDIWAKLNAEYRRGLVRKVRDTLTQLRDNGLDEYLNIRDSRYVSLTIFDANGDINQATLNAIKQRIEQAGPPLTASQTSLV